MSPTLIAVAAIAWFAQALGLSRLMTSRGFHPLPYLAVPLLIGPASWPLALLDLFSGPPAPRLVRRGRSGEGELDMFVAFEHNAVPEEIDRQLQRLFPYCRRLVLARIVRAGGPAATESEAEEFLNDLGTRLRSPSPELQVIYGGFATAVERVQDEGHFALVLRSDQPDELFGGDGSTQEVRCKRIVDAA